MKGRALARLGAVAVAFVLLFGWARAAPPAAPKPYSDWAAVVVAGDDHAGHADTHSETFDNARRDVSAALRARGFLAANLRQFSLRPERYPADHAAKTDRQGVAETLRLLAAKTTGGCLLYITSHGGPEGVVIGEAVASPPSLALMIDRACPGRPTIVVISACFSGVFIPALAAPDRLVLTAARKDRSSFGCSEEDRYPYFDDCVLRSLPHARDFTALAPLARACVERLERETGAAPASQPQTFIGARFRRDEPPFARRGPPGDRARSG